MYCKMDTVVFLLQSSGHVGFGQTEDLVLHRFCYSVELRSVKNLNVTPVGSIAFIYLR